jgi:hypothetical protein
MTSRLIVAKQEKLGERMAFNFAYEIPLIIPACLPCRKILRNETDDFTSSMKEVVLRTSIALKSLLLSARFQSAKLGSNDKHHRVSGN